tara:strand:- start:4421 stop:4654 length:234 start_codon:yes stop_codon:yes gene_type:complete
MADITVRVPSATDNVVKVPSTYTAGGTGTLAGMTDVSIGTLQNGMVLVYNATIGKWEASMELTPGTDQNLDINGGNF